MKSVAVINIVGLSQDLISSKHTPFLYQWSQSRNTSYIEGNLPAVTCTSQSNYLTGKWPNDHGIVANGWYFKDECEVKLWKQSNRLVQSPKLWDVAKAKNPSFTCANMFWWYNMYSNADYTVTPRPVYRADGLKLPDCYSHPPELRDELQSKYGQFPLFKFWGPVTGIESTQWIAEASKEVYTKYNPTLNLVYLPHLDYNLQRVGPNSSEIHIDLKEIDEVCKDLIEFYESNGVEVFALSEYGITEVNNPIHLNRFFRKQGWIQVRTELGNELLDFGASKVFAVADHQIAHIYINDPNIKEDVKTLLSSIKGIDYIIDKEENPGHQLSHERSGDLIAVSDTESWFTYYYWDEDSRKPDFAKAVDIHRKPGYDPVELFMDPGLSGKLKMLRTLLKKKLGFRYLIDIIPTDASLVKGSHGAEIKELEKGPLLIGNITKQKTIQATDVFNSILEALDL